MQIEKLARYKAGSTGEFLDHHTSRQLLVTSRDMFGNCQNP